MTPPARLLFLKASTDICAAEVAHLQTVANMFSMESEVHQFENPKQFEKSLAGTPPFDYIYLGAHASPDGFGEADGSHFCSWWDLGVALCATSCLKSGSVLMLGCCRGGLKTVALTLLQACESIDYIVGPRWTVTGQDITTGFHVFIYNMLIRREQPGSAALRATNATGYDFFCHDRVEIFDELFAQSVKFERESK